MKEDVNDRIINLLKEMNIDEQELASMIGKSPSTIYRIVKKEVIPSKTTIKLIADATNRSIAYLQKGTGSVTDESKSITESKNPWENEAFESVKRENSSLKQEVERLWTLVMNFTQKTGNPNFLKASDVAGIPLYLLNKAGYSVANAQC